MRRWQASVGGLMALAPVVATLCAAVRDPTPRWAGTVLLVTWGMLIFALVGAVCRRGKARVWWLGFALFGWGYLSLAMGAWSRLPGLSPLPTTFVLRYLNPAFDSANAFLVGAGTIVRRGAATDPATGTLVVRPSAVGTMLPPLPQMPLLQIGHSLWALVAGLLGGSLCRCFFAPRGDSAPPADTQDVPASARSTPAAGRRPFVILLAGLVPTGVALGIALRWGSTTAAAVAQTVSHAWVGLAVLASACARGSRQVVWLGAALFGAGYLFLGLHSNIARVLWLPPDRYETPLLGTVDEYEDVRTYNTFIAPSDLAGFGEVITPRRRRTFEALEQPVPIVFPNGTPLNQVLEYIRDATRSPELPAGVPIYVDPIALLESEKTETFLVRLDVKGIPLKTTLRLLLMQLGMDYVVRDGLVHIVTRHDAFALAIASAEARALGTVPDPVHDAARGVFALVAACLGAALARFVAPTAEAS